MRYSVAINGNLTYLSEQHHNLSVIQKADLAKTLSREVFSALINSKRDLCILEDGREKWMVRYDKFCRVKSERDQLRRENEKLRAVVAKLTGLEVGE